MLKILNNLYEKIWFPISFRIVTLIVFIGLVIIGFSSPTKDPFFLTQLAKTNLTTSFVWRLWWPLIVLTAIFFGRFWCVICPVELITSFFSKIGFRLKRPKWLLSGWVITIFYMLVLVIGVTLWEIDLNPKSTSLYLLAIMGLAVLTGLIFEKNTFCRYVCPVGYLLGLFSKMAAWGWRVKSKPVCNECKDKSCIKNKYTYQINYKSCGVDLVPADITNNNDCLLCGACLKTCKTYKTNHNSQRPNPALVKIGFANDLLQLQPLRMAEWFFIFVITGSMIFEMTHFQIIFDAGTSFFTTKIPEYLGLKEGLATDLALVAYLFLLLPAVIWILPLIVLRSFRIKMPADTYVKNISLVFLPVIAAFYIGLVIMEVVTKFPYYKYIAKDIRGVETIKAMLFKQIEMPQLPYWTEWIFMFILLLALTGGVMVSFKVIRKMIIKLDLQSKGTALFSLPFIFIFTLLLGTFMYLWF